MIELTLSECVIPAFVVLNAERAMMPSNVFEIFGCMLRRRYEFAILTRARM